LRRYGGAGANIRLRLRAICGAQFYVSVGESLADVKLHYTTLGKPVKDAQGGRRCGFDLHGTGGRASFLAPYLRELFNEGQLLSIALLHCFVGRRRTWQSSNRAMAACAFPRYDYDDMVRCTTNSDRWAGRQSLRLIFRDIDGCMHSWVWGETYPDFMDALMPMACLPVQIAGATHVAKMDGWDRKDPEWKGGEYTTQPLNGLRIAEDFLIIAGSAPVRMQKTYPTRDAADKYLDDFFARPVTIDANDFDSECFAELRSFARLEKIKAQVMYINSADDFINPPGLGSQSANQAGENGSLF